MSLTSYRAAPPRVKFVARTFGWIGSRFGVSADIAPPAGFLRCVKRKGSVFCRPGDDLLSHVLRQSTIGAEAFDGRVRDGIGSYRFAESHQAGKVRYCAWGFEVQFGF